MPAKGEARIIIDVAVLITSSWIAKSVLRWKLEFDSLEKIIENACRWDSKNPKVYKGKVIVEA